jgi:hypothetical protein
VYEQQLASSSDSTQHNETLLQGTYMQFIENELRKLLVGTETVLVTVVTGCAPVAKSSKQHFSFGPSQVNFCHRPPEMTRNGRSLGGRLYSIA